MNRDCLSVQTGAQLWRRWFPSRMHMSVADFFFCRGAYTDHFNLEMQGLTRQRMIAINGDFIAVYSPQSQQIAADPAHLTL